MMISMPKVIPDYFPLTGGLDQVTPAISKKPGRVIDAQNYEPETSGGYRRINGYERFDGHASPTDTSYWILPVTLIGSISVGATITGAVSGATAKVLVVVGTNVIVGRVVGTFTSSEGLTISGTPVATMNGNVNANSATLPSDHADYKLLAANDQRLNILAVPGSGMIRGIWVYNDTVYAFRDNVGSTECVMYKATASGWSAVALGREIQFGRHSATVTITIAAPGVVTWNGHGLAANQEVTFSTTGALPTGLTAGTTYYVRNPTTNTFELSATSGGASITTSGSQSGTHTCSLTSAQISTGDTVTGATSGATAVVTRALLRTGTWTNAPVGTLVFASVTGTFQNGEALRVGGNAKVVATSADTAITLLPGGRFEFCNANFTGSTDTKRMYGCDGMNKAFEFDGTVFVPIRTGMANDAPSHITEHKNFLFLSFRGSVQRSGVGNPYAWTVVLGADEIATGYDVSGFLKLGGNDGGSALAIFTDEKPYVLYGDSSSSFKLVPGKGDVGYLSRTMQLVSNNAYGLTARGIQSFLATQAYGDFEYASVSHFIEKFMTAKKGLHTVSTTLKGKSQYRLYFSDGTGLAVGLTGDKVSGIMPLNYGRAVRCICTATLSTGEEVTYFGSDDGYIYQDSVGTSFDGEEIEAWCRTAFNHSKSPRLRKRYHRAVLEVDVEEFAQVNVSYDLGYGSADTEASAAQDDQVLVGGGGYWDQFTWDQFNWDAQPVLDPSVSLDGTQKNISLLFYSNRAQDLPHTIQGVTIMYSPRRPER